MAFGSGCRLMWLVLGEHILDRRPPIVSHYLKSCCEWCCGTGGSAFPARTVQFRLDWKVFSESGGQLQGWVGSPRATDQPFALSVPKPLSLPLPGSSEKHLLSLRNLEFPLFLLFLPLMVAFED